MRHSNSKNLPYFFNAATKESRWEFPANTDTEKLKAYVEQNHSASVGSHASGRGSGREGKIRAAHLLVKHRNSRRPSSWRETDITRTKEEAIAILEGYEKRVRDGEISLGDLALTESDCTSARKKGDLSVPFLFKFLRLEASRSEIDYIWLNFCNVVGDILDPEKCRRNSKSSHSL